MELTWRLRHSEVLSVFTVYVPENSGPARFNYIAASLFENSAKLVTTRAERIPQLVESGGGYGWIGNDLWLNYACVASYSNVKVERFFPWPDTIKPRLCLLKPEETKSINDLYWRGCEVAVPIKYANLALTYLQRMLPRSRSKFFAGGVEKQIRKGNADLAIDIVYSGRTIHEQKLSIEDTIFAEAGLVLLTKD